MQALISQYGIHLRAPPSERDAASRRSCPGWLLLEWPPIQSAVSHTAVQSLELIHIEKDGPSKCSTNSSPMDWCPSNWEEYHTLEQNTGNFSSEILASSLHDEQEPNLDRKWLFSYPFLLVRRWWGVLNNFRCTSPTLFWIRCAKSQGQRCRRTTCPQKPSREEVTLGEAELSCNLGWLQNFFRSIFDSDDWGILRPQYNIHPPTPYAADPRRKGSSEIFDNKTFGERHVASWLGTVIGTL